jgi:hypothetical protein
MYDCTPDGPTRNEKEKPPFPKYVKQCTVGLTFVGGGGQKSAQRFSAISLTVLPFDMVILAFMLHFWEDTTPFAKHYISIQFCGCVRK